MCCAWGGSTAWHPGKEQIVALYDEGFKLFDLAAGASAATEAATITATGAAGPRRRSIPAAAEAP